MEYKTFAALVEESNSGWVWLWKTAELKSRKIVRIVHIGREVFCECRTIDNNFLKRYNLVDSEFLKQYMVRPRKEIPESPENALVISEWYRSALGIEKTQEVVPLTITPVKTPFWRSVRAAAHHPDAMVRLATYLGAIGVWSGVSGLLVSWLPQVVIFRVSLRMICVVFLGLFCLKACWPLRR